MGTGYEKIWQAFLQACNRWFRTISPLQRLWRNNSNWKRRNKRKA